MVAKRLTAMFKEAAAFRYITVVSGPPPSSNFAYCIILDVITSLASTCGNSTACVCYLTLLTPPPPPLQQTDEPVA